MHVLHIATSKADTKAEVEPYSAMPSGPRLVLANGYMIPALGLGTHNVRITSNISYFIGAFSGT